MIRYAAAVAMGLALGASPLQAQTTVFTVTTTAANVHAGPSTGSPVVGVAARGRTLEVSRELGSWVRVAWPAAASGSGYVHVTWGKVGEPPAATAATAPMAEPSRAPVAGDPIPGSTASTQLTQSASQPIQPIGFAVDRRAEVAASRALPTSPRVQRAPVAPVAVSLPSHIVGIGGRMPMPATGIAASGRMWLADVIGIQVEGGRTLQTGMDAFGPRLRTMTLGVSGVVSAPALVGDAVLVRPYFGGGVNILRSTLSVAPGLASTADYGKGYQLSGGSEFTWAGVPNLALSADVRREWAPVLFPGFETKRFGVGVSAHWYVK